jgi:hypothetical protein
MPNCVGVGVALAPEALVRVVAGFVTVFETPFVEVEGWAVASSVPDAKVVLGSAAVLVVGVPDSPTQYQVPSYM